MIPMLRACLLAAALLPIAHAIARAEDQAITLRLGAGSALTLDRPFKIVMIGDPDIVDVRTQSERVVILVPLELGATNLVFLDQQNIAIANVRVEVRAAGANRASDGDSSTAIAAFEPGQLPIVVSGGRSPIRIGGHIL
jgi:Flp pilus assembly secretin CpaC